ncbi:MAG: glycosyltransferase family A protein [Candidatus Kaistia colombiensis]|nr:MAG: glycosyltransferase family A protein [Kaistia sp.]
MNTSDFSIQNVGAGQLARPGAIRLPLVSFVLTRGAGSDFGATIEAVRAQDYPRCEIIVVDAGATDASRATLEHQIGGDPRFRRVPSDTDPGPFALATLGLAAAEGEFVAFLDATELPLPGFASAHIQTHLASRHNVAFTASQVSLSQPGPISPPPTPSQIDSAKPWLQPATPVLRLACLDDDGFAHLASSTALVEPMTQSWTASPDAAQMYRRFVIDLLQPVADQSIALPASPAAHYAPLCQLLGGSAAIQLPLSRKLPGSRIEHVTSPIDGAWSTASDRHKLCVWAANGADLSHRIGAKRYWDAFASMLGLQPGATEIPTPAEIADLTDGQFALLLEAFGEKKAIHGLNNLLPRPAILVILRKYYGHRLPLRVHWAVRSAALRQMHEGIRLYLRARRTRRQSRSKRR